MKSLASKAFPANAPGLGPLRFATMVSLAILGASPAALAASGQAATAQTATSVAFLPPAPITTAAIALAVVTALVAAGIDVRLVLLLGALPLFVVAGRMADMLAKLVSEMANAGTVVPICSAVGFAFVLRTTGCDQH
jgi:hypothetical protein